ncbi:MAG: VanZ family protein [Phycisphaerales bacterium JB043]
MPEAHTPPRRSARPLWIIAFILYALALAGATHWPQPILVDAPPQSDKVVHFVAFFLWTTLLALTRLVTPSRESLPLLLTIGLCYAVLDELTQGIPGINRHVSMGDLLANASGVIGAVVIRALLLRR